MKKKFLLDKSTIIRLFSTLNLKVYAICVVIASFIWLVMTLSDNYNKQIDFPVKYSNYPKGLILVNNPITDISVDVESQGFELASIALSEMKSVNIDLSKINFKKTKYGRYVASVATKDFRYNIVNQLQVDDVGKDFIPDSIFFVFDSLISKDIPVKFNSKITFKDGYTDYQNPIIEPKLVTVTGPAVDIRKINSIETELFNKTSINSEIKETIKIKPLGKQISFNTNHVEVIQKVAKYSEFTINKTIKLNSNIANLKVKMFPNKVKVIFTMPLPEYKLLNDTSFMVAVRLDSIDALQKQKLLIEILRKPKSASNIKLNVNSIEYLILD